MNEKEIEFIRGCLPEGRTKYHTFKDRYVFKVLSWKLRDKKITVRELKAHPTFSRFAGRPAFREFLSRLPDGKITREKLHTYWPRREDIQTFRLTLDRWGDFNADNRDWNQTSRRGLNLVLQLNFPVDHGRDYSRLAELEENPLFLGSCCHPVRFGILNTMSWARIDIDLDDGSALIEEIQTDWMRDARYRKTSIEGLIKKGKISFRGEWRGIKVYKILKYIESYIQPLEKIWDEATLETTLWFLHEELGLTKIYYHTWDTGLRLKRLDPDFAPPRSLYTQLPQRFGFDCVDHRPEFLNRRKYVRRGNRKNNPNPKPEKWWFMDLEQIQLRKKTL